MLEANSLPIDVEVTTEIQTPVTKEMLTRLADAGYPTEVFWAGRFLKEPLMYAEGVELTNRALRAAAAKLDAEAEEAQKFANMSDDPRWRAMFQPKAARLWALSSGNLEEARTGERLVRGIPELPTDTTQK